MKKRANKALELDDPLCCCEYVDRHGGRSHMAACCCDCEDLDEACDRWMKREPQNLDSLSRVAATVTDRLRVPWISGAKKVDLSSIPPLILLPILLHIAALHYLLGIVVLTALPGMVLWYYYFTHRKKGRTLFFLSLALFSLFYMYYLFLTEVVPRGDITNVQLGIITLGVVLTLIALMNTKKGPGYVKPSPADTHSTVTYPGPPLDIDPAYHNGSRHQVVITNPTSPPEQAAESRAVAGNMLEKDSGKRNWCPFCKLVRPPRAGHCRICGACVLRLDHHCVWINSCVGQANHCSFLLTLLFFLLTSLYGISLVLRSVCPTQSVLTALLYCPDVYSQSSSALCFTCAWYSSIVTGGLLHLLVLQLINVSYNVTEREARIALRDKTGRSLIWGLIIDTGVYSHGFRANWTEFLTMGETLEPKALKPTDLV
ncbi:palmitoyltransferase ZDHHC23-B isoform X1 [Neoarius graeffei]|uniref:palmitoyltransferase ZDHHC23-B isoform X1 n=2 Tax=Neoarius graeffei TaxID=443677 RepID=UPI00298C3CC1|nr:palmitoyltransferase ZDHHC23-B isoform X1 [Neoarius graeffei]XP_060755903.1 palmitoyltransferase ZDHHC23-B isoform X1 [Neoarius graeffei]